MAKLIVVECCPHCQCENEKEWDVNTQGWKIKCADCGAEILLCDECLHAEDNPQGACPTPCLREANEC